MSILLIQKLKRLPLLESSPDNLIGMVESRGTLRRYRRDELVYVQGWMPKAAYLIVSGMVNRETTQDGEIVLQLTRALSGNWLGMANVTSRITPYMHSAIVVETSEILSIGISDLASLRCNQEFAHYLLQVISKEQLVEEERYLNNLSSSRSYDKLILFLAAEMERVRKRKTFAAHLPQITGSQDYLAKAIGVTRETVTRNLKPLLAAGILQRSPGVSPTKYTILKQKELQELASSPLRRSELYKSVRSSNKNCRYSDVA